MTKETPREGLWTHVAMEHPDISQVKLTTRARVWNAHEKAHNPDPKKQKSIYKLPAHSHEVPDPVPRYQEKK